MRRAGLLCVVVLFCWAPAVARRECRLVDHGGAPSAADNAAAIGRALAACAGGGTVLVDGGAFRTGPVRVSGRGIQLEVSEGAMLVTAFGPDRWPIDQSGRSRTVIEFANCSDCGLVGGGTIWGKGGRPPDGDDWYYLFDQGKLSHPRPLLVQVIDCARFVMGGADGRMLKLLDAPQFNVALDRVAGAEIHHLNITSNWYTDPQTGALKEPHNTDGIDPGGGSHNIHIHHVWVHNGDDSVAVKPSGPPCTREILVEDSHFERGHGCSVGSVGGGCVENVLFRNISMKDQMCGCRVKTYSQSPGHVRNISWERIRMTGTAACMTVNANYKPVPPHPTAFINVSDLRFRDIVGTGCADPPEFVCPEQSPCRGIELESVQLTGSAGKKLRMKCSNAFGRAAGSVSPDSCLEHGA